jgi:hypothetical protein
MSFCVDEIQEIEIAAGSKWHGLKKKMDDLHRSQLGEKRSSSRDLRAPPNG